MSYDYERKTDASRALYKARIESVCRKNDIALSPPAMLKLLDTLPKIRGDSITYPDLWALVRLTNRGLLD